MRFGLFWLFAAYASCKKLASNSSKLGLCDYADSCIVGGIEGACVSIIAGCCPSGTVTPGLCPGSQDIECCTEAHCSTPAGSGVCKQVSACSGSAVPGYCSGPDDLQCCVSGGGGCILGSLGGCDSSSGTAGITRQIIAQLNAKGYSFRALDSNLCHCPGFACTLQGSAADALEQAASSVGDYITLNSAFRSSAEQYVLYQWYLAGQKCGISLAAPPGSSNHEGGRAIDTSNYDYWEPILGNYGWTHSYPGSDPVHFDYYNAPDLDSQNLLAFQELWNANNPGSPIATDGIYGDETAKALYNTPCGGW